MLAAVLCLCIQLFKKQPLVIYFIFYRLNDLKQLQELYAGEKYILGVDAVNKRIHIILRKDSDENEQLKSGFQAEVINVLAELRNQLQVSL